MLMNVTARLFLLAINHVNELQIYFFRCDTLTVKKRRERLSLQINVNDFQISKGSTNTKNDFTRLKKEAT